jgi:hypothetical protein
MQEIAVTPVHTTDNQSDFPISTIGNADSKDGRQVFKLDRNKIGSPTLR